MPKAGMANLEARARGVPCGKALRVLGADASGHAVGSAEDNGALHDARGHVVGLGRRVDDVVNALHGKVERHKLADWLEAAKPGANSKPSKAHFCDWGVDDAALAVFLQKPAGDLVCAMVLANFLTHQDDALVLLHHLVNAHVQRITDGHLQMHVSE